MIELSIKRPLVIFVLFSIIALLGLVTFGLLNINLLPKLETNYVTVVTVYPGASASEVENSVTKKIEDALSTLENLEKIKSTSQEGLCVTSLELKSSANPNLAVEEAQRKINAILADLPTGVKAPTISKVAPDEMPILRISATANMYPTDFYKTVENQIQPRLAKLQGVGQITLVGGSKREIRINIDKEKLQSYNLSILQVLVAIQKANQDFPTGNVETSGKRYSVRLAAKYASMEEVKNTAVITGAGGSEIRLNDVAEVQDGIAEQDQLSRLNTVNSIGIEVKKQTDANTLEVARLVKAELKKLEEEYAGSGMKFEIGTDSSTFTMESVNSVVFDLMLAIVIVSFVCLIFLHSIRSAIAVMVAVPLSMLPSFIFLYLFGYSLNIMSLMSLSLAVGILVDDSIVVVENIFRHMEMGKTKLQAALDGGRQIVFTAASITLVISVVFLPLAISGGIIGKVLQEFAFPLLVSTLTSLLVSFTLTPLLLSRFAKLEDLNSGTLSSRFARSVENSFEKLKSLYGAMLRWGLGNRKTVIAGSGIMLICALALLPTGLIGVAFIPDTDQGEFIMDLEMAPQITVAENSRITQRVEQLLLSQPEVKKVFTSVGLSSSMGTNQLKNYVSQITVSLSDKSARSLNVADYGREMRTKVMQAIPGIKVRVKLPSVAGGTTGAPIEFSVKGTDLKKVESTAAMVMNVMKRVPGTADIKYSVDDPKPEIQVKIDRDKMEQLGLTVADVGATMRTALAGNTDSKYRDGAFEYDINIMFDRFDKQNINDVGSITFFNDRGGLIYLNQFADITQSVGPSTLERTDRISSISVSCNVIGRPAGTVADEIRQEFKDKIPEGVSITPEGILKIQGDSFKSLGYSMIAAIILVYLIMVALYNSLLHPLVVLFSIPTAIIGSFLALGLTLNNLTIFSIIGLIALIGLVAKNAILLVDFTNHLRAEGRTLLDALIEAGRERLRPILMTTFAMVFGMLPIALASGAGAELKNGMAWVIIGGLLSSLAITLVLVPTVYYVFESMKLKSGMKKASDVVPAAAQASYSH